MTVRDTGKIAAYNRFIDLGEASAIALAMETGEAVLIVDDKEARQFALSLDIKITGTLGVLIRAYKQRIISDLSAVISRLEESGFHLPPNTSELISLSMSRE
jgi:predicted nucleic acid-binding protein